MYHTFHEQKSFQRVQKRGQKGGPKDPFGAVEMRHTMSNQ